MNWCEVVGKEKCKTFKDCDHCYAFYANNNFYELKMKKE